MCEKGAPGTSASTAHRAPSCCWLRAGHVHGSSLPCGALLSALALLSFVTAPHRTDPSLQAAARNFQGVGVCSVLVPGTTERDMYLQQTHDAQHHLGDACGLG